MKKRVLILIAALCWMVPLGAQDPAQSQDQSQQKDDAKKKQKQNQQNQQNSDDSDKAKPLFKGNVNAKSSSQKKDTTSLGFNGLDPQGKVDKDLMASNPTAKDEAAVEKLSAEKVDPADLKKFIDDGQLKSTKKGGGQ